MFLSLSFSLPSPLSKNKLIKSLKNGQNLPKLFLPGTICHEFVLSGADCVEHDFKGPSVVVLKTSSGRGKGVILRNHL